MAHYTADNEVRTRRVAWACYVDRSLVCVFKSEAEAQSWRRVRQGRFPGRFWVAGISA